MNLGIDFGSTYTIASLYDENNKSLDALLLGGMTSPCIPTVAALKKKIKLRCHSQECHRSDQNKNVWWI